VFEREGLSDLAIVQLKHKVEEHKDYKLGTPLQPIKLATESPQPGDKALTAGWGVTGYNQELSTELRSLELTISTIEDLWVYTHITDERGRITDPCKGDSGGPLAVRRNSEWQLIGVLKGEGYNCRDNQTTGDGLWTLLLGHWYEIMALYYVKSILTEISASRQDRRVLQKSKIIRIEFLSKWGMLQTSRYV